MLGLVLFAPPALRAQGLPSGQIPSPGQARALLQSQPGLAAQIRERLSASGLTDDQIRMQLRAAGYPEDLIDQILGGGSLTTGQPGDTTARGVTSGASLSGAAANAPSEPDDADRAAQGLYLYQPPEADRYVRDSLRADSLGLPWSRPLQIFGMDVFGRRTTQFQATRSGPAPASYRLGAGDRLSLVLTGDVQRVYNLEVSRDGMVVIPDAGQLYVANLTLGEFERQALARLGRIYSGVGTGPNARVRVDATITRIRTVQVFVTGEVARPGAYQIAATGTALTALYAAGGPTVRGSFRRIVQRRGGAAVDTVDLYDYLLRGASEHEIGLLDGDVIFVPTQTGRVKVAGRVVRPAIYELKASETLRELIGDAGGFDAEAVRQRVQIHRILPAQPGDSVPGRARVVVDVGPEQFAGGVVPAVPMLPGDSVFVFEVSPQVGSFVTVRGDVYNEGVVGFRPGMRLSEAVRLAGGPKPDVYRDQLLVTRVRPDSTRLMLRSSFVDSLGTVAQDLPLQERDEITVFSRTTFRNERYVVVTGAVRKPGRIRFRDGMTVRDAILLSEGLAEDAYLREAEIARVPEDRSHGEVSTTIRVQLDSTYLFARREGEYPGPPGIPAPASGTPEIELQPYDNLLILRAPEYELPRTVKIAGQVKYPGPYALRTKTERLDDLIQRAGGLTREAYPDGIEFFRAQDSIGRVGLDLKAVLKNPKHRDNLILQAGDSVFIPEFRPTVLVKGLVNAPGAVAFEPGRNIDWYVRAAGGYAETGDRARVYVTQPNGEKQTVQRRFLLADDTPTPRPGAVVTVPERKLPPGGSPFTSIAGIAAQLLAAVATVIAVTK